MPSPEQRRHVDEVIETLSRAQNLDDVLIEYDEAVRLRWRRWPDLLFMGLALAFALGAGRAWASADLTGAAICAAALLAALALGWTRITRFVRLDRAVSRWKSVADARAAAGKR